MIISPLLTEHKSWSQGGSVQAGFTVELIRLLVIIFYYKAEAQKMEKISLQHVQDLIHQIEEVLGLLKILCDHQFHVIASALTKVSNNIVILC